MVNMLNISKGKLVAVSDNNTYLDFQYNPTSISEKRSVRYNFSEGQGQSLPFAQFGMVEPTEITLDLFMLNNAGLNQEIGKLRSLTLPKTITKQTHYQQVSPHKYQLYLHGYGSFIGVVTSIDITVDQMNHDMTPVRLTATMSFTVVSASFDQDVSHLNTISGR